MGIVVFGHHEHAQPHPEYRMLQREHDALGEQPLALLGGIDRHALHVRIVVLVHDGVVGLLLFREGGVAAETEGSCLPQAICGSLMPILIPARRQFRNARFLDDESDNGSINRDAQGSRCSRSSAN
jgi:hypothetical protein